MCDGLAHAGFEQCVVFNRRQIACVNKGLRVLKMPEFAQLLRCHRNLVRPASPEYRNAHDPRVVERIERVAGNI